MVVHHPRERLRFNSERPTAIGDVLVATEAAPSPRAASRRGAAIHAHARRLSGAEAERAARLLARKHPLLQGVLVPLAHRTFRAKYGETAYFELIPVAAAASR
jgi:hypothetical protein